MEWFDMDDLKALEDSIRADNPERTRATTRKPLRGASKNEREISASVEMTKAANETKPKLVLCERLTVDCSKLIKKGIQIKLSRSG